MTYRIITLCQDSNLEWPTFSIENETFSTLEKALEFLQINAHIDIEYNIVKDVKIVQYKMQKVLNILPEIDSVLDNNSDNNDNSDDTLSVFANDDSSEEEKVSFV